MVEPAVVEPVEKDDVKSLVQATSKNALSVFRKIRSGEIEIPDNLDDDEKLSNYLQQALLLEMVKEKKVKRSKKKVVSSSDESESD